MKYNARLFRELRTLQECEVPIEGPEGLSQGEVVKLAIELKDKEGRGARGRPSKFKWKYAETVSSDLVPDLCTVKREID